MKKCYKTLYLHLTATLFLDEVLELPLAPFFSEIFFTGTGGLNLDARVDKLAFLFWLLADFKVPFSDPLIEFLDSPSSLVYPMDTHS